VHIFSVHNPLYSFAIVPPRDGCGHLSTIQETAAAYRNGLGCVVATNAAFFDTNATHRDRCIGAVVSDGEWLHSAPLGKHATFGIARNGSIYTGYLSQSQLKESSWLQLVQGSFWLVRHGENYVTQSALQESLTFQSGNGERFRTLRAPRSALGHTSDGRVLLAVSDGNEAMLDGATLDEFADFLIRHGAVNAINLDGGGSSAALEHGVVTGYPSDECPYTKDHSRCSRQVSVITCVHTFHWFRTESNEVNQGDTITQTSSGTRSVSLTWTDELPASHLSQDPQTMRLQRLGLIALGGLLLLSVIFVLGYIIRKRKKYRSEEREQIVLTYPSGMGPLEFDDSDEENKEMKEKEKTSMREVIIGENN